MTGAQAELALPAALLPFASTLQRPEFGELACDTWHWVAARAGAELAAERRLPVLVTIASVYARLCAPTHTTRRCYDAVARFTLLFFLVDDAALDDLPDLVAQQPSWSIGRYTGALRSWLGEFHEQQAAPPRLRESFEHAYHDYLAARRDEHRLKTRPMSLSEHWTFRRRSIFMDPYLDLWMILLGIQPDALAEGSFAEARRLAVDLVLLANDLGSVERDRQGGASPDDLNLLHTFEREHGVGEAEALERLIAQHNALTEDFRRSLQRAIAARPGPHAERYADLLVGVVEGNVGSVLALGFRYPGAEPWMQRLSRVTD